LHELRLLERHTHRSGKDSIDHPPARRSPVFLFAPERSANLDPESPMPRRCASIRSITMIGCVPILCKYSSLQITPCDLKPQAYLEHFCGVEIKLGIERALDVGGLAETMLLTREQEIADGYPAAA